MSIDRMGRDTEDRHAYLAEILISLKPAVNDPEGLAIRDGLHSLGYNEVEAVRAGKYVRVTVEAASEDVARARVAEMCDRLLANPVTETYEINITALAVH